MLLLKSQMYTSINSDNYLQLFNSFHPKNDMGITNESVVWFGWIDPCFSCGFKLLNLEAQQNARPLSDMTILGKGVDEAQTSPR